MLCCPEGELTATSKMLCRHLGLVGQRLAALDASIYAAAAAAQPAAQQQSLAACWLVGGCCGLVCRLAEPPVTHAFLKCMQLVLHSGAALQQSLGMALLCGAASVATLVVQTAVQLWAVTAWAAIVASLATNSGAHCVPPALLHQWLQQTAQSLCLLNAGQHEQGGQCRVAVRYRSICLACRWPACCLPACSARYSHRCLLDCYPLAR